MTYPQYQFNLGANDPLLDNSVYNNTANYETNIENQIQALQAMKEQLSVRQNNIQQHQQPKNTSQPLLWDDINREVSALTDSQKETLFKDEEYASNEYSIQNLLQAELISLVKSKLQSTKEGKDLLENQLKLVQSKKKEIVANSDKEIEIFKKFQIAAQSNPSLTYKDFCLTLKQ